MSAVPQLVLVQLARSDAQSLLYALERSGDSPAIMRARAALRDSLSLTRLATAATR